MKLTAQVKLKPTLEQHNFLLDTLETTNAACNEISGVAWENRTFNQFRLQKLVYYSIRASSGLTAQVVVRAISKVSDAYKAGKKSKRTFKRHGGIAYDDRILRWYIARQEVSIWTVGGRQRISFVCGPRQLELLQGQRGESDLFFVNGDFYLAAACDVEEPIPQDFSEAVGVDMGIVNIATTSDGESFAGNHLNSVRYRRRRLRTKLQKKGTRSAQRRLKKLSGKESRFAKHTNHVISKHIVAIAKDTGRAIALEELGGIRERVTVGRRQRATLHSWSFHQLRTFITYKARRVGVQVIMVNPKNTSRTCPACGCIDKANRKSQSKFLCISCGFSGPADIIAAGNISRRAVVNRPNVSTVQTTV